MPGQAQSTGRRRFASDEETESTGQAESQDSAAIAQDLRNSRTEAFVYHEEPFLSVRRTLEEVVAASKSSMAKALHDFDLTFESGSSTRRSTQNRSRPGSESSFREERVVESTNTAVQNVQIATQFFPITPLNVENRLLKPTEYFESLEELEREVQSSSLLNMLNVSSLLDMLNVSFPVKIHM
jgi:hypothetical protein